MTGPCGADFVRLADELGGIPCDADPVVTARWPADLANWTLPVVEALIIGGAVLALLHAIRELRRGRPAYLALWLATLVYVFVIEPPLYFPETFGIEEHVGLIFVHNTFSITFLFDRLPLYIVALYPAGIYLAHALVDRLGIFRRHGIVVGAVTAGALHHLFYEIFDQLGPQLRWWAWNPDAPTNAPFFASVPLTSAAIFATFAPAVLVGLARWWLFRGHRGRKRSWALRTVGVGLATVALLPVLGLPSTVLGALDGQDTTVERLVLWTLIAAMGAVAAWAIATTPRPLAADAATGRATVLDRYEVVHGGVYLAVFTALWLSALPALLGATGGTTADGAPVGSPWYALACGILGLLVVVRAGRVPPAGGAGSDRAAVGSTVAP